jgi:hypothetical protein
MPDLRKPIVHPQADGSVWVHWPAAPEPIEGEHVDDWHNRVLLASARCAAAVLNPPLPGETHAQHMARIAPQVAAEQQACRVGTAAERAFLEGNRRWRNAWRHAGGVVSVSLPLARLHRKAELLARRRKLIDKLRLLREVAQAKGQTLRVAVLGNKLTAALAADGTALEADLLAVTDLATLDTFTPAALADDEPDPD